jgi:hypothetical protein
MGRSVAEVEPAGVLETTGGHWRVEVSGVGAVVWYRLVGADGTARSLPSLAALTEALATAGVDLRDLREVEPRPV